MLVQFTVGLACLLQVLTPAIALPTEQQPLIGDGHKNVQVVRAEYVPSWLFPLQPD